jgi:hypothetical protein
MMKDTEQLIQHLAESVTPTRPLARPSIRTGAWLAISIPYLAVVLIVMVLRHGLPSVTLDTRFIVEVVSGLGAGIAAAMCAFGSVIPGFNRRFLFWLALPLAVWLGSVSLGCIQEWVRQGTRSLSLVHDPSCFPFIVFLSSFPAVVLALMLRRGAPLTPHLTAALGGLAAAGLGNLGLRLVFPEDANVGLLVWHIGGVFVLAALAAGVGNYLLNWRSIR